MGPLERLGLLPPTSSPVVPLLIARTPPRPEPLAGVVRREGVVRLEYGLLKRLVLLGAYIAVKRQSCVRCGQTDKENHPRPRAMNLQWLCAHTETN